MPRNYITLPRSALYELVWTKPVTELAKEFGISDVALAKRCRSIKIPLPPRGYWARVAAGQKPTAPIAATFWDGSKARGQTNTRYVTAGLRHHPRRRRDRPSDEPAINFDPDRTTPGASPTFALADAELPTVGIAPTTDLAATLDIVKRTARHYKHPNRADLKFTRGEAHGPILHLSVSPDIA